MYTIKAEAKLLDISLYITVNIYGENLLARKVAIENGYETLYYLYNGHSDVTALMYAEGEIAGTYYYDAFGNILEHTGTDSNITYSEYQYDQETGLYYLNARMYDPITARFLQEDTYGGESNDPLSLNRYAYCHNEPLIYSDPTGHMSIAEYYRTIDYYAKDAGMTNVHLEQDLRDNVTRLSKAAGSTQNAFSQFGLIPVIGSIIDAINGGIYALRGKKVEAAVALVSILPIIDIGVAATKLFSKGIKALGTCCKK